MREHYFDYGLGGLGALLERLLLRRILSRQLRDITLAQKLYYETGKRTTPAMVKVARSRLAADL